MWQLLNLHSRFQRLNVVRVYLGLRKASRIALISGNRVTRLSPPLIGTSFRVGVKDSLGFIKRFRGCSGAAGPHLALHFAILPQPVAFDLDHSLVFGRALITCALVFTRHFDNNEMCDLEVHLIDLASRSLWTALTISTEVN